MALSWLWLKSLEIKQDSFIQRGPLGANSSSSVTLISFDIFEAIMPTTCSLLRCDTYMLTHVRNNKPHLTKYHYMYCILLSK